MNSTAVAHSNLQCKIKIKSDSFVPSFCFCYIIIEKIKSTPSEINVLCACVNAAYCEPVLRHYIPLRQWAGHLCVNKEGLELSFALDVNDASTRAHVAQGQKDATRLLRHLQGKTRVVTSILVILHD